ncbi:MAG TPA: hypothetical protein PLY93_11110 [Turneriella sp.]|nr:hypothetical protein [Turneriella sp.]
MRQAVKVKLSSWCTLLSAFVLFACGSSRDNVFKIGIEEGWLDQTRYVVLALGIQEYTNEPTKVAVEGACAIAEAKIPQRFSEIILGDTTKRCEGVDPTTDSLCDWGYRLDRRIFFFRGVDIKRRHDFTSKKAICEVAHVYYHPALRYQMQQYAARFNLVPAIE